MKKNNLLFLALILVVVIALGSLIIYQNCLSQKPILFYGIGCPHCENVEKFINDNGITQKISFTRKEVFENKDNATEMARYAKKCGLDLTQLGVPFFWTGNTCLSGDEPIIEYFKNQTGIK